MDPRHLRSRTARFRGPRRLGSVCLCRQFLDPDTDADRLAQSQGDLHRNPDPDDHADRDTPDLYRHGDALFDLQSHVLADIDAYDQPDPVADADRHASVLPDTVDHQLTDRHV